MSGNIEGYMQICEIGCKSAPDLDTAVGFALSIIVKHFDNGRPNLIKGSKDCTYITQGFGYMSIDSILKVSFVGLLQYLIGESPGIRLPLRAS